MNGRVQSIAPRLDAKPGAEATVAFGQFQLDTTQRRIEKDGHPVPVSARAFDILVALIDNAGTVVSKNELMARVWPGVNVDEGSLRVHVAALRKALGDGEAGARYLSTVSGHGYCFVAPVSRANDVSLAPSPHQTHNLPTRQSQIVGRGLTVEEIAGKLVDRRFVTVVGPGGMGKTTVAVSAGHALLEKFAGQVLFIDLGAISDTALVPSIVASTLGLPASSIEPSDGLAAFLRDREMLLILDSCEHVIEAAAALAERLFKEAPQLHILATSRELLRVEGEHIHRLLPLASPPEDGPLTAVDALAFPAVELFVRRAAASSGEFELTDANAADVGNICRRLDGIALAIELTASRVSAYGVKPMIELLDNHFNLLWEGRRTALPRHRTMRAAIEWSYNLLSEPERAVLCRLSTFLGSFTLDAARSVAAKDSVDDAAVMAALASLVAKSMVTLDTSRSSARYRLLDTTRAYMQEKLAASEGVEATARRHARYFLELLERTGDEPGDTLSEIADQFGNIRGALMWCFSERGDREMGVILAAASMPLLFGMSMLAECELWARRAIQCLEPTKENARQDLALHAALASARLLMGQIDERTSAGLNRALRIAENAGDVKNQLRLLDRLHLHQLFSGNLVEALNIARRGDAIAASGGDPAASARMRVSLSISCHFVGDVGASRAHIDAALAHPGLEADVHGSSTLDYPRRAQITLARILWLQGYPDQAMATVRRAVCDLETVNQPIKLCRGLLWAFAVFYWNEELEDYEEHIEKLRVETRRFSLGSLQIFGEAMKGMALLARGEVSVALAMLRDSVGKMQSHGFGGSDGFHIPLAVALAAAGQHDEALSVIDRAIAHARRVSFLMEMPEMLRTKGDVLAGGSTPDLPQAESCFRQSLELARHQGALGYELRAATSLARLWSEQRHRKQARDLLAPVYDRYGEGFNTRSLTTARNLLRELGSPRPGLPVP